MSNRGLPDKVEVLHEKWGRFNIPLTGYALTGSRFWINYWIAEVNIFFRSDNCDDITIEPWTNWDIYQPEDVFESPLETKLGESLYGK